MFFHDCSMQSSALPRGWVVRLFEVRGVGNLYQRVAGGKAPYLWLSKERKPSRKCSQTTDKRAAREVLFDGLKRQSAGQDVFASTLGDVRCCGCLGGEAPSMPSATCSLRMSGSCARFCREIDSGITTRLAFLFRTSWTQTQTLIFA